MLAGATGVPGEQRRAHTDEVGTTTIGRVEIAPIHLGTTEVLSQLYAPTEVSGAPIAESEISRSMREARLEQVFSQLRDTVNDESRSTRQEVAVAIATGTSLTIGYVAWLIRGGVLVSSLLTSMPAWRLLDPLPILGNVKSREATMTTRSIDGQRGQGHARQTQGFGVGGQRNIRGLSTRSAMMRKLSAKAHISLGLAFLVVSVLLVAAFVGLIPTGPRRSAKGGSCWRNRSPQARLRWPRTARFSGWRRRCACWSSATTRFSPLRCAQTTANWLSRLVPAGKWILDSSDPSTDGQIQVPILAGDKTWGNSNCASAPSSAVACWP